MCVAHIDRCAAKTNTLSAECDTVPAPLRQTHGTYTNTSHTQLQTQTQTNNDNYQNESTTQNNPTQNKAKTHNKQKQKQ